MSTITYEKRRGQIEDYFDRTAAEAWSRLTSDAPVGRIRTTVRAGRDRMRQTLLDWLPTDLRGRRVLDAGCGTGALALEVAARGATVVAIDLSPTLIRLALERAATVQHPGRLEFIVGDMSDPSFGDFDHVVAMDSLIHYKPRDAVRILSGLAKRSQTSLLFTFAPKTLALALMHATGRLFPRGDRAPSIEPIREITMRRLILQEPVLRTWQVAQTGRIESSFYISQALELRPK